MKATSQQPLREPRPASRLASAIPAVVLGIAVTILVLFVELQLLKATQVWPENVSQPQRSLVAANIGESSPDGAAPQPLRVQARSIVPDSGTNLVSHDE